MDSFLEKIISEFDSRSNAYQNQIKKYVDLLKGKSEKVVDAGKIKIEIKKNEFEINSLYKKIGKYVSNQYISDDIVDYTYDDVFLEKLDQIKKINTYLKTLKKSLK